MNLATVALLALVLAVPSALGLAEGGIDADGFGIRVLLAVAAAVVAEGVLRRFVDAVRPVRQPVGQGVGQGVGARQEGDPPAA